MIKVSVDLTNATKEEEIRARILIDDISNRLPVTMLQMQVIEREHNPTPLLPSIN